MYFCTLYKCCFSVLGNSRAYCEYQLTFSNQLYYFWFSCTFLSHKSSSILPSSFHYYMFRYFTRQPFTSLPSSCAHYEPDRHFLFFICPFQFSFLFACKSVFRIFTSPHFPGYIPSSLLLILENQSLPCSLLPFLLSTLNYAPLYLAITSHRGSSHCISRSSFVTPATSF